MNILDWLTFFSTIIPSLAWPVTLILALFIFKKQIVNLLPDLTYLRHLKIKDFEIDFDKQIEETNTLADRANLPDTLSNPNDLTHYLNKLSKESPRASIIESWILVEKSILEYAKHNNLFYPSKSSTNDILRIMVQQKLINTELKEIIDNLRILRNRSVHEVDYKLHYIQAQEYVELSLRVIATMSEK